MVGKAKQTQSGIGRRTRTTTEKVTKSRPRKQPRYPLSVHFTVIPDAERLLLVDELFCPKLEAADAGQGEKGSPFPVHRRNLRPRKAVPVEVEEVSSSTNSEEGDPPCSGRCMHEMLKRWMEERFEKLENKFDEFRRMICRGLGMPEGSNHNTRKRKARDDPQRRQSSYPDSIGIAVANSAGEKKTLSRRGSGGETGVAMGSRRNNTASSQRESGRENKSGNGVTTPVFGNASLQETRTPSRPVDELSRPGAQQSDNGRFSPPGENKADQDTRAPKGVEGAKQHENELVADHTPPPVENDAAQGKKQTQSVGHESGETSNLEVSKSGEQLEKVHSPMAGVQAIVKEINAEFPVPEEEERYDSCKDAMSTDSLIQENLGNQVSEPEADSDVVASGGKRHRMRSIKIKGVYTPYERVKNLFKSEEKPEYNPIGKANRAQTFKISTGHSVSNGFFLEMGEPGNGCLTRYC
ncbi:hypothetical protein Bca52824_001037 [Brassica carinata]|uniref:Uncharacterized protein n=1 Tax=Brassica carinata TaxID=52824 RepID=A0A8X8BCQ1_BRACI|nr:hypothetical protein Bca52824_001037 [Brassica carinata]